MAALLVGGAAALAACASGSSDGGGVPKDKATPKPGGTFTFPLPGEPLSIEPLNAQDSSGLQVAHQVFQGLTKWVLQDDGVLATEPDIADKWESADGQTWTFHLKTGVTFQSPGQPPGDRPGLRRFVDPGHRPGEPVLRGVHPRAHRGLRRPRLSDRPGPGPHRRQGHRCPDAPGHAALPLLRLSRDAGPPGRCGHPGRLHRPGRRQGVRQEARGHRPLRRQVMAPRQGDHAGQERGLLGHRSAGVGR